MANECVKQWWEIQRQVNEKKLRNASPCHHLYVFKSYFIHVLFFIKNYYDTFSFMYFLFTYAY